MHPGMLSLVAPHNGAAVGGLIPQARRAALVLEWSHSTHPREPIPLNTL